MGSLVKIVLLCISPSPVLRSNPVLVLIHLSTTVKSVSVLKASQLILTLVTKPPLVHYIRLETPF